MGFTPCKLGVPLFDNNGRISKDCTFEQLANFVFFTETHRPLIGKPDGAFLGKSESGAMVYLIFDGLEANNVFEYAIMRGMPRDPIKIVYADSCRISETRMRQWNVTFKQIPYEVNVF